MTHWILIVSILAGSPSNGYRVENPKVVMQGFGTQRACGAAADVVRNQYRAQSDAASYSFRAQVNAMCVPME
jgi:hypothetical protein